MTTQPYSTPRDVDRAIKDAASQAAAADSTVSTSERIRHAWFDRFLWRVFSESERSEWVLKGGTGVLARVPSARATKDVDLYFQGYSLDSALADLKRVAQVDLGDHFRFVYTNHETTLAGNQQPDVDGYRVSFEVYLGTRKVTDLRVDLCVGSGEVGLVDLAAPANRVHLPRLITYPYRLYPVVNQIAEKVCATMTIYPTGPSSRERDLVDLVVLATTQRVDASDLRKAIGAEARRRNLADFVSMTIPAGWGSDYVKLAKNIPACAGYLNVSKARVLMHQFIDRILSDHALSGAWDPGLRIWNAQFPNDR